MKIFSCSFFTLVFIVLAQRTTAQFPADFLFYYSQLTNNINDAGFLPAVENQTNKRSAPATGANVIDRAGINAELAASEILEIERLTEFDPFVSPVTRQLIHDRNNLYALVMIKREIEEDTDPVHSSFLKDKVMACLNDRIYTLSKTDYPYYTYRNNHPQPVKFVSIRTGNDLFTPAGLAGSKSESPFWQRNDDRDYTGSFLVEVGTDYFRMPRRRKLKTYQTIFWGFDVFTPYFKDSIVFRSNDTFNPRDRPHASFQYFGWSKKGIALRDRYRWAFFLKVGKIGGYNGRDFQVVLHQDVSFSPRPRGWGAQIANTGRLGVSFEGNHEWMLWSNRRFHEGENDGFFRNRHIIFSNDYKAGTYMTTIGAGLAITNKSFKENNHNFINKRLRQTVRNRVHHLMYSIGFYTWYVKHNTMLQGFGIFDTKESKDDFLTPRSLHKLPVAKVNPFVSTLSITLSYTARYFTLFYKWQTISSETRRMGDADNVGDIGIKRYATDTKNMNIHNRWHHFATIGLCFNVIE